MNATERRDQIRAMLADLRLPGALEAVDEILAEVDRGSLHASQAIERLLTAQITLRNNHRLHTAMRSSRLPAIKTLQQFDFTFQPSIRDRRCGVGAARLLRHARRPDRVARDGASRRTARPTATRPEPPGTPDRR